MSRDRPSDRVPPALDSVAAGLVFYEWDIEGDRVRWAGDCGRLLGYARDEMPANLAGWLALVHPDEREAIAGAVKRMLANPAPTRFAYRIRHRDGAYVAVTDEASFHTATALFGVIARRDGAPWLHGPFKYFVETAPLGVLVVEPDGRLSLVNAAALRLFGYREEELLGQPVEVLLPEPLRERHIGLRQHYYTHDTAQRLMAGRELPGRRKDGTEVPVAVGLNPVLDDGQMRVVCTVLDLSELKRAERDLVRFFELSLDLFCIASLDGYFRRVNVNFSRVLGYATEELLSRPFLDFVHPDDVRPTVAAMSRLNRGEVVRQFRNRYRDVRGEYRWLEWNAQPIAAEGVLFAVARDVTEQVAMQQRLTTREARERAILDNTPALVYVKDLFERYEFVNRQLARLLARPREEVIGRTDEELLGAAEPAGREYDRQVLQTQAPVQFEEVRPGDDGPRTYLSVKFPLFGDAGQVQSVASISADITDRLRAQDAEHELRMAQVVQQKLYPARPPRAAGFDVAGAVVPVSQMCGDYFDYIWRDDHRLTLAVGDVSGHGFGPALQMVEVRALVRVLLQGPLPLPEVLERLNGLLHPDLPEASFISLFLAELDLTRRELTCAGAGHIAALLRADGRVQELPGTGPLLGLDAQAAYDRPPPLPLYPDDLLLLFTDGLVEVMSPTDELFGMPRLLDALVRYRHQPVDELMQQLFATARAFATGRPLTDDMSIVLARAQEKN